MNALAEVLRGAKRRSVRSLDAVAVAIDWQEDLELDALLGDTRQSVLFDAVRTERFVPEISVGLGVFKAIAASGPKRFESLSEQARDFASGVDRLVTPLRFYGSAAFRAGWLGGFQSFGDARFVTPRILLRKAPAERRCRVRCLLSQDELFRPDIADEIVEWLRPQPEVPSTRGTLVAADTGDAYERAVADAVRVIERGELEKVVLSRSVTVTSPQSERRVLAWLRGEAGSVTFLLRDEEGKAFLGATPELLLQKSGAVLATEAVAGTEPRRDRELQELRALLGRDKDRREHELVVREIEDRLRSHGANIKELPAPRVRTLSRVHHLVTEMVAEVPSDSHALTWTSLLHPTPALCGTPSDRAGAFIEKNEPTPRGHYGGPIGWFDSQGDGEFAVALRCALVGPHEAIAFAGAGIVRGSEPALELAETEAKLGLLLAALGARGA